MKLNRLEKAMMNIRRVLRPGGRLFFMEVTAQALNRRSYRKMLVHPNENRFSKETLVTEPERQGLIVGKNIVERLFGDFIYGVGRR